MSEPLRTLGRYALKRRLAAGGMGEVYLGEVQGAANFTKQVAIKRILPHLAANEAFVRKFIDEANLMVQLHHGNIVPVLELGNEGGEFFIVMEYLPGRDLKAALNRLRAQQHVFPVELGAFVAAELLDGLDYAHRKTGADGHPLGIVHRDISPSNVVLGAAGEVKLVDFGIARARGGLHESISGTLQGKFTYMSPEQAEGLHVDARTDIFSTGLVLYEMLTGVRPLEGESETETLRKVRQSRIAPPSTLVPGLGDEVDTLVMRALAHDREERYPTAGAMRREIAQFLSARRSTADASALQRFLAELFPEGVVPPSTEPGPLSLDDALKLQLGALTPSVEAMGHTRTATGPAAPVGQSGGPGLSPSGARPVVTSPRTFATPGESQRSPVATTEPPRNSGVTPALGDAGTPSFSQTGLPIEPPKKRRVPAFLLGVVLTAAAAVGFLLWQQPEMVELVVTTMPVNPVRLELTLDGKPFDGHALIHSSDRPDVCAKSRDFKDVCKKQIRIRPEDNTLTLSLEPRKTLVKFLAEPAETSITIDGIDGAVHAGDSVNITLDDSVTVVWQAPGYRKLEKKYDLFALTDAREIHEHLEPDPGAPPVAPNDPSAPNRGSLAPETPRTPATAGQAVRARTVQVESTPPGAKILMDGREVGVTPYALPLPKSPTLFVLRRAGFADATHAVDPTTTGPISMALAPVASGYLTVRVLPPAGTLVLDGVDLKKDFLDHYEVPSGEHELTAVFNDQRAVMRFKIEPGSVYKGGSLDLTQPSDHEQGGSP